MSRLLTTSERSTPQLAHGKNKSWWPAPASFLSVLIVTLWSVAVLAAPPAHLTPSIAIDAGGLSLTGLTPRGTAIVFGITRETNGDIHGYARHDYVLRSVDALGNARINHVPVPPISAWCVVDLQTGAYAITAPSDSTMRRTSLPPNAFRAAPNAQLNSLRLKHDFLEVLWVRPGVGVWAASVGDGGRSDTDHTVDGHLSIAPEKMEAIGASPPAPNHYLPQDTFILVDPDTMELVALPVTP
jgi:hypothetical protein